MWAEEENPAFGQEVHSLLMLPLPRVGIVTLVHYSFSCLEQDKFHLASRENFHLVDIVVSLLLLCNCLRTVVLYYTVTHLFLVMDGVWRNFISRQLVCFYAIETN